MNTRKFIKTFSKMGRASFLTKESLKEKLVEFIPKLQKEEHITYETALEYIDKCVEEAFSQSVDKMQRMFLAGVNEVLPNLESEEGANLDSKGLDGADRAALDLFEVIADIEE